MLTLDRPRRSTASVLRVHKPLGAHEVIDLLVDKKLLSTQSLTSPGFAVYDVSRRNRNYKVRTSNGPSYLVKQALTEDKALTVQNEADWCIALGGDPALRMPRVAMWDETWSILVLQIQPDARNLMGHYGKARRLAPGIATAIGRSAATLHRTPSPAGLPDRPGLPLVFSFDCPDITVYYSASDATLRLLEILHGHTGFGRAFEGLRGEWRDIGPIHGDLRLDNCVIDPALPARSGKRMRFVDWEMAMRGDPAWDLATVVNEYLSLWLDFAPLSEHTPPESYLQFGTFTLPQLTASIAAMWAGYRAVWPMSDAEGDQLWLRVVRFAAARLVQSAYERTQFLVDLPGQVVLKLQLARNLLEDPQHASTALLGIPLGGAG
jgi:Ser/Thr protein kinase RdoA (MazF antagonist)